MNELTQEERNITVNLLSQISVPVKDAGIVIEIIKKLQTPLQETTQSETQSIEEKIVDK